MKYKKIYKFDFKEGVTIEDLCDLFEKAWPCGIHRNMYGSLNETTKRHVTEMSEAEILELPGDFVKEKLLIN